MGKAHRRLSLGNNKCRNQKLGKGSRRAFPDAFVSGFLLGKPGSILCRNTISTRVATCEITKVLEMTWKGRVKVKVLLQLGWPLGQAHKPPLIGIAVALYLGN